MTGTFVGRQAIYDRALNVHGYELLYRSGTVNAAQTSGHFDGDAATGRVIVNAFLEIGAQRLVGDAPCFLNLTSAYITGELPLPLPADRVVVEILEDIEPSPQIIAGVRRMKAQGVRVAMDDYIHRDSNDPLLKLSDYVKIDLRAQDREQTEHFCELLRPYDLKLLAEKVETMEEYEFCRDLGFEYFQGYFLTKPEIIEGRHIPANRIGMMRLLARLIDPDVELEELEEMVSQDAALAYKLLCYANSARYSPRTPITAVGQTMMMLGLTSVRSIVSLIVLMDLDDKPGDLIVQALTRAKMCELLAEKASRGQASRFYTVGLLSTLDAVAGAPMEAVLENLPLSQDIEDALLREEGELGAALRCARAFEAGCWDAADFHGLDGELLTEAYAQGVEHSRDIWSTLRNDGLAA